MGKARKSHPGYFHEIDTKVESHGNPFFGHEDIQAYRDAYEHMIQPDFPEYIKGFR